MIMPTLKVRRQPAGFTLVEVLMAAATLAFVVAAVSQAVVSGQSQTYDAIRQVRALALAEALIEEILSKPYVDPSNGSTTLGPESGESSRALYDNADDYHGLSETLGNCQDALGAAYPPAYSVFARSVTCAYTTKTAAGLGSFDGLMVTVTVTDDHGRTWSISRFITKPPE